MQEEIEKTEKEIAILQEKLQKLKSENSPTVEDVKKIYEE